MVRRASSEGGFNLVVLVMAVTVLSILVTLALPAWSHQIQREREAELIFRGLQYAEAIRVFKLRHNRDPVQLRELVEVQPRSIRQLWKNPITEDGSWLLLPAGAGKQQQGQGQNLAGVRQVQQGRRGQQDRRDQQGRQQEARGKRPGGRPGRPGQPTAIRVIPGDTTLQVASIAFNGVASPEGDAAIKTFMGSNEIKEWRFTIDLVQAQVQAPGQSFAKPVHSAVFWRPFPPGVIVQTQQQRGHGQGVGGDPTRRGQNVGGGRSGNTRPGTLRPGNDVGSNQGKGSQGKGSQGKGQPVAPGQNLGGGTRKE
jgi:type II secretory pathway pseudopilin PulG